MSDSAEALIEGLLFMVGEEGIKLKEISDIVGLNEHEVQTCIYQMKIDWQRQKRGLQIVNMAQMYQMTTLPEHYSYFEKLAYSPKRQQLSRSSLETLAIIAYRQPITRMGIEEIRGVKSEGLIYTLQRKDLICEVGRIQGVGRPILYGTTKQFLNYFGLNDISELPTANHDFHDALEPRQLFDMMEMNEEHIEEGI